MDSVIPLGQKNTLAEYMILFGVDNRPPMLDKDLYDSWKSRMELYMQNREHERMILESVENGPLIWPTVVENGVTRTKKYVELSAAEKIQADCDMKATNIILQGLPADIYSLVNHHRVAKDLWKRVQLLMQGETLHNLLPEWSKFVTDVKLVKDLHTTKFDQLHAYLEQHELHANEVRLLPSTTVSTILIWIIHPTQHYSSTYPSQPQFNHSSVPPSYPYQSQMNHQTSSVPQISYQSPQVTTQPITESLLVDLGFTIQVFSPGDDLIACVNKAMAFLVVVASSRFPSTNNQLRTSSNPRNQATIQDGGVTVQQVQGRQGQSYSSTGYKSNATSSGGNNVSGQARIVKCDNCQAEAQEAGQILDEEQLAFLADLGVLDGQVVQTIIPNNAAFQNEDLDTYDSDGDDISNGKAVLMANISNYGSDVISEAQQDSMILSVIEQMSEQMINHVNNWEKANKEQNNESVTAELERYKEQVKTFEQRLNIDLTSLEKMIDSQMDDMIKEKLALKEQVDSLEQNLSKQIKEKECLLQTFTVFKSESKEKEDKYMKNEIDLEKKIKELDNIIFKDPEAIKQNISHKPIDYEKLNRLSDDFGKRFTPQQELSAEQAFLLRMSNPTNKPSDASPIKIKAPKELPKQFDSIKKTCIHTKEQNDSLIDKLNLKSAENEDIKAQIQDKVFVITSLKNDLRKLKGKAIVDIAAQTPSAYTIIPGMFKLDLEPLTPRLLQNREAHIEYLKYTQEQADILRRIVEKAKAKQPLDKELDFACNKKNDRISRTPSRNMKNKVEAQPRKVNKKNHVVEPIRDVNVKHSLLNALKNLSRLLIPIYPKVIGEGGGEQEGEDEKEGGRGRRKCRLTLRGEEIEERHEKGEKKKKEERRKLEGKGSDGQLLLLISTGSTGF
ncbi:hypothetical protein Tco_1229698 [Tanacetum coccineum]